MRVLRTYRLIVPVPPYLMRSPDSRLQSRFGRAL